MLNAFTAFFQLWRKEAKIFEKRYQILLFSDSNVQPIEQRMLDQRPRESGILSRRTQSSSQTVNVDNTSIRNLESPAGAAQLRNLFPTVGKRSFGSKSSNGKCV